MAHPVLDEFMFHLENNRLSEALTVVENNVEDIQVEVQAGIDAVDAP